MANDLSPSTIANDAEMSAKGSKDAVNTSQQLQGKQPAAATTTTTTTTQQTIPMTVTASVSPSKQLQYDPTVKHPLLHSWTLWYDPGSKYSHKKWGENIKEIYTVSSVEDFWRLQNNILHASQLQFGTTYNWFHHGIQPKWEDPSNQNGGKWIITVSRSSTQLDRLWLWLLLACIGEQFDDESKQICGAVLNIRKGGDDRICLWIRDSTNKESVLKVGHTLKKLLELHDSFPISYYGHNQKNLSHEL
jgi:translation initiation factor 4E